MSWRWSRNPLRFEADARVKRQCRFGEAVDGAHGPAGTDHRADRGAVWTVFDGRPIIAIWTASCALAWLFVRGAAAAHRIGLSPRGRSSIRTGKARARVFGFRRAFGAQKPAFPAFEHQRGEDRGHVRPGVDVDPVWQDFRARDGRVSVHDDLAPRALVAKEVFPDPKQSLGFWLFSATRA